MTTSRALPFLLTALICAWPAPAHANKWLAWLAELSGPGPFKGPTISGEIYCWSNRTEAEVAATASGMPGGCRLDKDDSRFTLDFEVSALDDRPVRYVGDTTLLAGRALFYAPLRLGAQGSRTRRAMQTMSVGAGLGLYRLEGDTLARDRVILPVMPLRLKFRPLEAIIVLASDDTARATTRDVNGWRHFFRAIEYRVGADFTLTEPNPADFVKAVPDQRREFIKTMSIQIDAVGLCMALNVCR